MEFLLSMKKSPRRSGEGFKLSLRDGDFSDCFSSLQAAANHDVRVM
jgi:hypothetical protein